MKNFGLTILLAAMFVLPLAPVAKADSVIASIPIYRPYGIAVNPNTGFAYVTQSDLQTVSVINMTTKSVVRTIGVGGGPFDAAVNPVTNRIYVSNHNSGTVTVIDGASGAAIATVNGAGWGPLGIDVDPLSNRVYVADYYGGTITVIDAARNVVIATITGITRPAGLVVDPGSNRLYVGEGAQTIAVIDGASNSVIQRVTNVPCPYRLGLNPNLHRLYVPNACGTSAIPVPMTTTLMTVIDTNSFVAIPVLFPTQSKWGASSATADVATGRVYVANAAGSCVVLVNGATNLVEGEVKVGSHPRDVAVNPVTHEAYVTTDSSRVDVVESPTLDLPDPSFPCDSPGVP